MVRLLYKKYSLSKKHIVSILCIEDINECNSNNGGCEHDCINTEGSYYCTCDTGYSLNKNNNNCTGEDLYKSKFQKMNKLIHLS